MWTGGSLASQPDLLAGIRPTRDLFSKKKKKWICHRNITRKKGFILTYMSRRMESIVAEKTWQQAGSNADGSRDLVGHQSRCGGWGGGAGCVCVGGGSTGKSARLQSLPKGSTVFLNSALNGDQLPTGDISHPHYNNDKIFQEDYSMN